MGCEPQAGGTYLAREGLKVPVRQPRRDRLWLNVGSFVRLRSERRDHVWAYDFVQVRTRDGRAVRLLAVIDEYIRECLAIRAGRSIRSSDIIETLAELMTGKGVPEHIRSANGPEFTASTVREWLTNVGAGTCTSSQVRRGITGTLRVSTSS